MHTVGLPNHLAATMNTVNNCIVKYRIIRETAFSVPTEPHKIYKTHLRPRCNPASPNLPTEPTESPSSTVDKSDFVSSSPSELQESISSSNSPRENPPIGGSSTPNQSGSARIHATPSPPQSLTGGQNTYRR